MNSSTASLTIASDRKSSTLVLPQLTLRDAAVYYCILREAHWASVLMNITGKVLE